MGVNRWLISKKIMHASASCVISSNRIEKKAHTWNCRRYCGQVSRIKMKLVYLLSLLYCVNGLNNPDGNKKRVKRIVGGLPAELPPEDDPVVFLHFGGKSASIRGAREFPHYVFRGIRFAHAPTGRDRFQVFTFI